MIYLPRYNEWISNREADLNKLPEHLLMLISSFQSTLDSWENAAEEDQAKYMKILRSTDAYISASATIGGTGAGALAGAMAAGEGGPS